MDSEVFSTERYVNSSQVTVSFGVLNDDWCLSKDMVPNIKRNIGQGIAVMEDMQVEQARDIEVLRHVEREMADAEYDPSPK